MNKKNYQVEMEKIIKNNCVEGKRPKLLLHVCCAPCSSYVIELLNQLFDISILFYNPNIYPEPEYEHRAVELKRMIDEMGLSEKINITVEKFDSEEFYGAVRGHESDREGTERCFICYELRMKKTAETAKKNNYDFFTTTLSISPLKNAQKLNEIGEKLAKEYGVQYLYSDFKKKNGYKRSVELSQIYNLYRQNYCGCVFSKKESETSMDMKE